VDGPTHRDVLDGILSSVCAPLEDAIAVRGGFDAVIGNPPYIPLQDAFRDDEVLAYLKRAFSSASFKVDTYHLFISQAISLLRTGGRASLITPANFLTNNHLAALRREMLTRARLRQVVVVSGGVFRGVSVDNGIFVAEGGARTSTFTLHRAVPSTQGLTIDSTEEIASAVVLGDPLALFTSGGVDLWTSVVQRGVPLGSLCQVNFGKQLRDRKQFTEDVIQLAPGSHVPVTHRPCYTGRDVSRYLVTWGGLACLDSDVARKGGCWDATRHEANPKLLTRQIGSSPAFAMDTCGLHCVNTVFMVSPLATTGTNLRYVLGLLNSRLLRAYWEAVYYDRRRTFPKVKGEYLKRLPIRPIDFDNPDDVAKHGKMVKLVETMLDLHKRLQDVRTPAGRELLQRRIDATDRQIDRLVYELYGLTEEEIAIVEGAVR